jgi:hypothetical protein
MRAGDAAQRVADRRVTSIEGVPGLAVHPGDGGWPPPKRRQGISFGMRGKARLAGSGTKPAQRHRALKWRQSAA